MCNSTTLNHLLFIQKSIEIINDNFREPIDTFFKINLVCHFFEEFFPGSQYYNMSLT